MSSSMSRRRALALLVAIPLALPVGMSLTPLVTPAAAATGTGSAVIPSNGVLLSGQSRTTVGGQVRLTMQTDGNLVMRSQQGQLLWHTATDGHAGATARMQTDGNLVVRDRNGAVLWNASSMGNPGATLSVQQDGNLVIYRSNRAVWNSRTFNSQLLSGKSLKPGWQMSDGKGRTLVVQFDGNVVARSGSTVTFKTNTAGHSNSTLYMQTDGNLVLRDSAGKPIWNAGTVGHAGAYLSLLETSAPTIFTSGGSSLWPKVQGSPNGTIARAETLRRAKFWVDSRVPYSQTNVYRDVENESTWRTDCSGLLSMAWHAGPTGIDTYYTGNFAPSGGDSAGFTTAIAWNDLRPGDALLRVGNASHGGHIVLFVRWTNSAKTSFELYEQPFSGATARSRIGNRSDSYFAPFQPIRYRNIGS